MSGRCSQPPCVCLPAFVSAKTSALLASSASSPGCNCMRERTFVLVNNISQYLYCDCSAIRTRPSGSITSRHHIHSGHCSYTCFAMELDIGVDLLVTTIYTRKRTTRSRLALVHEIPTIHLGHFKQDLLYRYRSDH